MNFDDASLNIPIEADITGFSRALNEVENQSKRFGSVFTGTIKSAVLSSKSFEDTLKSLALRISGLALEAGLKPLENSVSSVFSNLFSSFAASAAGTGGGSGVVPFAKGGVVASPAFFNFGKQMGVMGEAGAEAIMPLARGSDGSLGVRAQNSNSTVNITFNVSTPNAQSFRKSEGQISAMLARTVNRGRRGL